VSATVVLVLRILVAACLYAFIGYAFYLLWRSLQPVNRGQKAGTPVLVLQPADKTGQEAHRIEAGEIVVGREKVCGLRLQDKTVSSRHARLSYEYKQWWVEDLGSTNGTYLNAMTVTTPTVLVKGDTITFGKFNFVAGFETKSSTELS
jgi:pSer/pThr/pTyr-binding forkhead associated (FHA) protein